MGELKDAYEMNMAEKIKVKILKLQYNYDHLITLKHDFYTHLECV